MSLVAEGFKRLGTLSYLIRNGSVKKVLSCFGMNRK